MGSGPYFTLPVTSVSYTGGSSLMPLGFANFSDSGSAQYSGVVIWRSTTTALLQYSDDAASGVRDDLAPSSTAPMTWVTNDAILLQGFYEAA